MLQDWHVIFQSREQHYPLLFNICQYFNPKGSVDLLSLWHDDWQLVSFIMFGLFD